MKVLYLFICICFLKQYHSQWSAPTPAPSPAATSSNSAPSLECITVPQLTKATAIACKQRENKAMWKAIIDCHRPMTDQFMRMSAEARCPTPKCVSNPIDPRFSMEDVFFNICGLIDGNSTQRAEGLDCLAKGRSHPFIMNNKQEVLVTKFLFGEILPCDIGKCILCINGLA